MDFEFEIFAQNVPCIRQNGYRHMVIEDCLLKLADPEAAYVIRELKKQGYKTEQAFTKYFDIQCEDPYEALLELEEWSLDEIKRRIVDK